MLQQIETKTIRGSKGNYPSCQYCGKKGHPPFKCWRTPDAKCSKCNQLFHEAVICKSKIQQQEADAQVADQEEEDQLFIATCFSGSDSSESWLIDSGCSTHHMTHDMELFKELRSIEISKVIMGNGQHITVKGKGTIAIASCSGTKLISDVFYVPEIDQNLLSVGQFLEKVFKVHFEDKYCLIKDASSQEMFKVKMRGKSFTLNPLEEEQAAFPTKESATEIWHKRLDHYHHQGLLLLQTKKSVRDLLVLEDHLPHCQACQYGQQHR